MVETVDFLPYNDIMMVETVGKKKNQNSKNSNFRDSFLNIEKEFHHTVK